MHVPGPDIISRSRVVATPCSGHVLPGRSLSRSGLTAELLPVGEHDHAIPRHETGMAEALSREPSGSPRRIRRRQSSCGQSLPENRAAFIRSIVETVSAGVAESAP
jgi:hypothetical protein